MAAYAEHAGRLGYADQEVNDFIHKALATIADPNADMNTLLNIVLETGSKGVSAMAVLDKANTTSYGNPEITKVNIGVGKNLESLSVDTILHDI